ncbi:MAG: hypothetical protein U0945_07405, partial [Flavobacterium sp.]|nr:hypothetical protein [Flavobacterium sp.]
MKKRFFTKLLAIMLLIPLTSCSNNGRNSDFDDAYDSKMISEISLPLGGNAFSSTPFAEIETITKNGIEYWTNSE